MTEQPRRTLTLSPDAIKQKTPAHPAAEEGRPNPSESPNPGPRPNPDPEPDKAATTNRPGQSPNDAGPASSGFSANNPDLAEAMRAKFAETPGGSHGSTGGGLGALGIAGPDRLSTDEWMAFFCFPFTAARMAVAAGTRVDLQSLAVTPATPGAKEAAQAAFNLCLQVPFLEPLTRRDNSALTNGIMVAGFVANVGSTAYMEFRQKRAAIAPGDAKPHPEDVTQGNAQEAA